MQDHPGAPGSARPGNTGTAVPAACGGAAVRSQAPGHSRPRATPLPTPLPMPKAPYHHRSGAASMASLGHAGCGPASAGPSVPLTTAPWPARVSRLLQEVLPRVPAAPVALTYPQSHSTTHQVHPAILAPTRPPPATAGTGFLRQRHSRAPPPPARRQPILVGYGLPRHTPPLHMVERGPGGEAQPPSRVGHAGDSDPGGTGLVGRALVVAERFARCAVERMQRPVNRWQATDAMRVLIGP